MKKYCLSAHSRPFSVQENGEKKNIVLYQIEALHDFADVFAGTRGGWVDAETALSQQGNCWIYDENSTVFAGARIEGNARLTRTCLVSHHALISGNVWLDNAQVTHRARLSDNVTLQDSQVRGECHIFGDARVVQHSEIIAAQGLTLDNDRILQIYDRATVSRSRVVHQAQIYGNAIVNQAFIEHRAEIFDFAVLDGNEENNVWVCDCAKVYGNARIIAGHEEDAIPTLRYSSQVAGNAIVQGNCVLKHHVLVGGHAALLGGPILLDNDVLIQGHAKITGDVIIEHQVEVTDDAVIEALTGDIIHIRGRKVISGVQHITRTPLIGSL